ncbi:MAG TPA: protein kinase [Isosphaeraceae bacterium]|jgi:serine/threonine protein kinase|nr:protein kinase [Isosphaeraceae bacterium]
MPAPRQVGDWIAGRFEIFEVHQGGMGVVYIAHDHQGQRGQQVVALKTLRDELLLDRERNARFAAECHLWVHLGHHPHIVHAHAVEEFEGRPHVVLELVTGGDLQGWIGTPRLDPPQALRFGIQFCLGMEHAIRQGLRCHRDIKPGNLLVTEAGELKITDFGLARIRDEILAEGPDDLGGPIPLTETFDPQPILWSDPRDVPRADQVMVGMSGQRPPASAPPRAQTTHSSVSMPASVDHAAPARLDSDAPTALTPISTRAPDDDGQHLESTILYASPAGGLVEASPLRLTHTGLLLGTVPYMAPEQFRDAKDVDVRADIYSFGIVFYQMLTKELPFKGHNVAMLKRQHAHYEPPSVASAIPRRYAREAESIDAVVQRCLRKDAAERYASIADLCQALTRILRRLDPAFDPRQ